MNIKRILARFFQGDGAQQPRYVSAPATAIIPAVPNFQVLHLDDAGEVITDPILAWVVYADGRRRPITVGEDRGPHWTIERSDGVIDTRERSFADRATWVETLKSEAAAAKAAS